MEVVGELKGMQQTEMVGDRAGCLGCGILALALAIARRSAVVCWVICWVICWVSDRWFRELGSPLFKLGPAAYLRPSTDAGCQ